MTSGVVMTLNWKRNLCVLGLVVSLNACALKPTTQTSYEGERLAPSDVARVIGDIKWVRGLFTREQRAIVTKVDEKGFWGGLIEVLPGPHILSSVLETSIPGYLGSFSRSVVANPSVTFTAEAGRSYFVPALKKENEVWIWVVDATTGETVAGKQPIGLEITCREVPHGFSYHFVRVTGLCSYKES